MEITILTWPFAFAILLAGVMGFAVQRGATCTMAAVEQLVIEHRWQRFLAILEAALWVLLGLLAAHLIGVSMTLPPGYRTSAITVAGGALLGLGAFINQGCVFGSIARLGSGEWNYVATPLGFFSGCLLTHAMIGEKAAESIAYIAPRAELSTVIVVLLLTGLAIRLTLALAKREAHFGESLRARVWHALTRRVWEPGAATIVIGITFVGLFLLVGAWAYTDVLAELARGTRMTLLVRFLLLVSLFIGAFLGGWSAGLLRHVALHPTVFFRCLGGGTLMGFGGGLIPGGNDGLLLIGMPLLWPYAWTAFAAMVITIVLALHIRQTMSRKHPQ